MQLTRKPTSPPEKHVVQAHCYYGVLKNNKLGLRVGSLAVTAEMSQAVNQYIRVCASFFWCLKCLDSFINSMPCDNHVLVFCSGFLRAMLLQWRLSAFVLGLPHLGKSSLPPVFERTFVLHVLVLALWLCTLAPIFQHFYNIYYLMVFNMQPLRGLVSAAVAYTLVLCAVSSIRCLFCRYSGYDLSGT